MNTMQNLKKTLVLGLAVIGLGGAGLAAQAQESGAPGAPAAQGRHGHAASEQQRQARWSEMVARRDAKLREALKPTAAQEPAFAAYLASLTPPARTGERAKPGELSAPARMERHLEMAKQHIATMESQLAALNTLYASLTPEQKKVLDSKAGRGGHGGRGWHHRMQGGSAKPG